MSKINISESVLNYERFINEVLKEDLKKLQVKLNEVKEEIKELTMQKYQLRAAADPQLRANGFKTQVHLGCNFFMEAVIPDTSSFLMNIGLFHYLELNQEEGQKYLSVRVEAREKKAKELALEIAEAKAHIKLMLFRLDRLQNPRMRKT